MRVLNVSEETRLIVLPHVFPFLFEAPQNIFDVLGRQYHLDDRFIEREKSNNETKKNKETKQNQFETAKQKLH